MAHPFALRLVFPLFFDLRLRRSGRYVRRGGGERAVPGLLRAHPLPRDARHRAPPSRGTWQSPEGVHAYRTLATTLVKHLVLKMLKTFVNTVRADIC